MGMVDKPIHWTMTPWQVSGQGGWIDQPVILIQGQTPFFADHPQVYIDKLQVMHDDLTLERKPFYTLIGEFKDALEQHWEQEHEEATGKNGHWPNRKRR